MIVVTAVCDNCKSGHQVYHLAWETLICQQCGKEITNDFDTDSVSVESDDGDRGWTDELNENEDFAQDDDLSNASPSDMA